MIKKLLEDLKPYDAKLVAVSKTRSIEAIMDLYNKGQRIFGENRVQELVEKQALLPKDIEWHMIGHLQSKKVKNIAPFVDYIHSVDSEKLLFEINKRAKQFDRKINVLLQFHIAEESSKYGFSEAEAIQMLNSDEYKSIDHLNICGVMGMATFTNNKDQVRSEFKKLNSIFQKLKKEYFSTSELFKEISMGMSGDYKIALEEGSTMVRIGSLLFA